jgi:hypothetical protein
LKERKIMDMLIKFGALKLPKGWVGYYGIYKAPVWSFRELPPTTTRNEALEKARWYALFYNTQREVRDVASEQ